MGKDSSLAKERLGSLYSTRDNQLGTEARFWNPAKLFALQYEEAAGTLFGPVDDSQ